MRADIFRKWLEDKGCRFDTHEKGKGGGNASLVIKLGAKRSVLPLVGTHKDLDGETMDKILQELGLDDADLPGHVEDRQMGQEERHDRRPDRDAKAAAAEKAKG